MQLPSTSLQGSIWHLLQEQLCANESFRTWKRRHVRLILFWDKRLHYFCELVLLVCCLFHFKLDQFHAIFNCVIKKPYVSLISWNLQTFRTYMPPLPVIRFFVMFNNSSAPVKMTSGTFGNEENTRTLLSLSEVTVWYLKRKAAPFLESGTSGSSFR